MPPDRAGVLLRLLDALDDVRDSGDRGVITQREHSLQCASRALENGADDELVVVALLHDVMRVLAPASHGETLARALSDRLSAARAAILHYHSVWQHDVLHGTRRAERFRMRPWYADACALGAWDAASFSPDYDSRPVELFVPMVRSLVGEGGVSGAR